VVIRKFLGFFIFDFGGLAVILYLLYQTREKGAFIKLDAQKFRSALLILLVFVILAVNSFAEIPLVLLGAPTVQIISDILTSLVFILFLYRLRAAIVQE